MGHFGISVLSQLSLRLHDTAILSVFRIFLSSSTAHISNVVSDLLRN